MIDPDKTWRGKRLDAMTLAELRELRIWVADNGAPYGSRDKHMAELNIIDEYIAAVKGRLAGPFV